MQDYIDIHNHILPGLDDGPPTIVESLQVARAAYENGITKIIATPHNNDWDVPVASEILQATDELRAALADAKTPLEIFPGNELRITPDLPQRLEAGEVLPLAGSRYILLEFPFAGIPIFAAQTIFQLRTSDWVPILAHPERIIDIQRKPQRLGEYIKAGCMTQLNAGSINGDLGVSCFKTAQALLKLGYVDIMATDSHSMWRAPSFDDAIKAAAKIIGRDAAEALVTTNPARILEQAETQRQY